MYMACTRAVACILVASAVACGGTQQALGQAKCTEAVAVVAPCEGTLLPDKWASDGLSCVSEKLPECLVQKQLADRIYAVELNGLNKQLLALQELNKTLVVSLGKAASPVLVPEVPWYEHRITYLVIGGLVGIGAGIGTGLAISATSR